MRRQKLVRHGSHSQNPEKRGFVVLEVMKDRMARFVANLRGSPVAQSFEQAFQYDRRSHFHATFTWSCVAEAAINIQFARKTPEVGKLYVV